VRRTTTDTPEVSPSTVQEVLPLVLSSTVPEVPSSCLWDSFDSLVSAMESVSLFKVNDLKCAAEITLSNHRRPILTPVKEIRTSRASNQIQCFILNQEFDEPKTISSSKELIDFATHFFSSTEFCLGLPYDGLLNDVKTMKRGYKNNLNRWQSTSCSRRINMANGKLCSHCCLLVKALVVKSIR